MPYGCSYVAKIHFIYLLSKKCFMFSKKCFISSKKVFCSQKKCFVLKKVFYVIKKVKTLLCSENESGSKKSFIF